MRFGWNIRMRLFVQVAALIVIFALLIMLLNTLFLERYYIFREKRMLEEQVEVINNMNVDTYDSDEINKLSKIERTYNVTVHIIDPLATDGDYKYATELNRAQEYAGNGMVFKLRPHPYYIIQEQMLRNGAVFDIRQDVGSQEQNMVYQAVLTGTKNNGDIIAISEYKSSITKGVEVANQFTIYITGIGILGALIWAFLYSSSFTHPIKEMNKITRGMAALDFSRKCVISTRDELGQLGESINHLSHSLNTTLNDLKDKNAQLELDIERERALDHMRKEFVSNVSHELKTPLSIIMGYSEGLRLNVNKDEEKKRYYTEVITDEAKKMNKLVHGLLELSHYQSGQFVLQKKTFSLRDMVDSVVNKYEAIFQDYELTVSVDMEQPDVIEADELRMEQVFTNYLNNAVSHADGDKKIRVTGRIQDGAYRVTVFNTGSTIAEEDIENLWTSFYKADKARSRAEGRYGLGLSIVKAIMDMHGGSYGVRNVEGGVEFWFDIALVPEKTEE